MNGSLLCVFLRLFVTWGIGYVPNGGCLLDGVMKAVGSTGSELGSNPPYIVVYRCPQLRRLVMPAWNRIKNDVICEAIRTWRCLESLTMPSIVDPPYLIEERALNCKNFNELKVMGPFDVLFASMIAKFLPNLKALSLRCSMIVKDALMLILDDLPNLEVLNISHCLLIEAPLLPSSMPEKIIRKLDKIILQKAAQLREFLTCTKHSCIMCQRTRSDEGFLRWYKYEEGLWKIDEARSLAL
ncbi:F-box/LRR-repeat protein At3g48880-like [Pistacia vera]|uniref:F-box/LRR-repeat protein At3g48880-like n=1 Tax=Pistacia vera TaxID=55513 RepID=UPI0012631344|nr:F-box/LRR-repeat protein At3g48880-like [Pistacia vera]